MCVGELGYSVLCRRRGMIASISGRRVRESIVILQVLHTKPPLTTSGDLPVKSLKKTPTSTSHISRRTFGKFPGLNLLEGSCKNPFVQALQGSVSFSIGTALPSSSSGAATEVAFFPASKLRIYCIDAVCTNSA